ncbi:MAG: GUN4 domain-containing protein [Cyanobacteria bacterium P01_G01_bin.67]
MRFTKQQANLQAAQAKIAEQESIIAQLRQQIEQLTSEPLTTLKDKVGLKSTKSIDYRRLRDLLEQEKWQEADEETLKVMLEASARTSEVWLRGEDIDNLPCEDLCTINQLWLHYSDGNFGFSVQKEIYESLGGTREYDDEIWRSFGDYIGWRKEGRWLLLSELSYKRTAPKGHLPIIWRNLPESSTLTQKILFIITRGVTQHSLFSRIQACNL